MSDGNIFQSQGTPAQTPPQGAATAPAVQPDNAFADLLSSIKNERGEPKYKDVQTALDALRHSQEFIPQVKTENEQLKRELEAARAEAARVRELEQTLQQLSSGQQPQQQSTPAQTGISADEVAKLVSQTLERQRAEEAARANTQTVVQKMAEKFGPDAEKVFYEKAKEFGMTVQQVNALAAQSPQAVLNLYGVDAKPAQTGFPSISSGGVRTDGYQPQPKSNLGKNDKGVLFGASTEELVQERQNAKSLVDELHNNGLTTYDLTDPKQYFKFFKN